MHRNRELGSSLRLTFDIFYQESNVDLTPNFFFDGYAIEYYDPDHSESEDRFLMLGLSYQVRVLVVSYTIRKDGAEIRIISARKATKKEQKEYSGEKL